MRLPCFFAALALSATALLLPSCSQEDASKQGKFVPASKAKYPKLKCSLALEVVSPNTEFFRGDVAPTITFSLRNTGLKPVTIYEWMAKEQDNLKISYVRCDGVAPASIPVSEWKTYVPKTKEPAVRMPLDLSPRNSALINVELAFIKDAIGGEVGKGKASYAVVGELNLNSVSAKSNPFILTFK